MAHTKGSDDLFRLIHSLNSAEKAYFRKFAQRHTTGDNQYLKLFDAISEQNLFDESPLKKSFKAYPVMKTYLFEMLLKGLAQMDGSFGKKIGLMQQLIYAEVLLKKGLQDKVIQLYEKGLAEAREHQLFSLEQEFIRGLYNNKWKRWTADSREPEPLFIFDELEQAADKQRNEDRYHKEHFKIHLYERKKAYGAKTKPLSDIVDVKFLMDESAALSPRVNQLRYFFLARYYNVIGDLKSAYSTTGKLFKQELKLKPNYKGDDYIRGMEAIIKHLISTITLMKVNEAEELLDKYWELPREAAQYRTTFLFDFLYYKACVYWLKGAHREGEIFLNTHLDTILDPENLVYQWFRAENLLRFKMAFEFSNRDHRQASLTINQYLAFQKNRGENTFISHVELLKILIQAEMGNYEIMRSYIRNALRKERQLTFSDYEKQFISALKKLDATNTNRVYKQLCEKFPMDGKQPELLNIFQISEWISSKKNNIPLAQVIRVNTESQRKAMEA